MSLKDWVLEGANRLGALLARSDLPPRDEARHAIAPVPQRAAPRPPSRDLQDLGPYAPLVQAIRQELEQFVATQVRLHLAIAEQDRFVLTGIALSCGDDPEAAELVQRFRREFRPEQVSRYLERHVIAALPDASALDLAQFGGLVLQEDAAPAPPDEEFGQLLELLAEPPSAGAGAYEVQVRGHWRQPTAAHEAAQPGGAAAGAALDVLVEDARGARKVVLRPVVPGRRYVIGKQPDCELLIEGTYVSRRHCELWCDAQGWWVLDAASTNGLRVEMAGQVVGTSRRDRDASPQPVRLMPGHRIVLSALAVGERGDYPALALQLAAGASTQVTPLAPASAVPATAVTPIARRGPAARWLLTAHMSAGERSIVLEAASIPFAVGRSRNQGLVIEAAHEGASGHHLDIVELDGEGAMVVVHGHNGVLLDGTVQPPGARFRWRAGESMVIGRADDSEPPCMLTLSGAA